MESAAANLIKPGDEVLVASCGKFGERFVELAETWQAKVVHHDAGWGNKVDPADLDRLLGENPGVEVVFTTFSETSTGVLNDIQPLTQVAHEHDALIVVDAISGLGAVPLPQDEWDVDVVVAGSQKALMCPPGLGFASAERARARARRRAAAARATTSTGTARPRASARTRPTARSRRPSRSSWRSTSRST